MKNFLIAINIIQILFILVGMVKGASTSGLHTIIPYAMALNSILFIQTKIFDTVTIIFNILIILIAIFMLGAILLDTTGMQDVNQKLLLYSYMIFALIVIPGLNIKYIRFK